MRRKTQWKATIILAVAVLCPRPATAGFLDFIWEMSGPQTIGVPIQCEIKLTTGQYECRVADLWSFAGDPKFRDNVFLPSSRGGSGWRTWLSLDAALSGTTAKDSDLGEFDFLEAGILSFEPAYNLRSFTFGPDQETIISHGVGVSHLFVFGKGFTRFNKLGIKVAPVAATFYRKFCFFGKDFDGFGVAATLRVFSDPFTSADFEKVPRKPGSSIGREWVWGFTVNLLPTRE